jgi:hypothetical protein
VDGQWGELHLEPEDGLKLANVASISWRSWAGVSNSSRQTPELITMPDPLSTTSFSTLLHRFFVEHLGRQRAVSPRTIAAYRDTFRLLSFAEAKFSKSPAALALVDLDAKLILSFLDHLEKERNNGARSRNAHLAALRSFLKYAAHHDIGALHVIEQVLAIPMKRFDRPVLGFLSRQEMQAILEAPDPQTLAGQRDRTLLSLMYNTGARVAARCVVCAPFRADAQLMAINRGVDPSLETTTGRSWRR